MPAEFTSGQLALLALGAVLLGFSRTGIPGIGGLFVVIFASLLPGRVATGLALPLLLVADLFGAGYYRQHARWDQLRRFLPWTAGGVVLGWLALDRLDNTQTTRLIGAIILLLLGVQSWLARPQARSSELGARGVAKLGGPLGLLAGFSTLVANAAGPIVNLYFLALRLPKAEFLGTSAVFFLVINWFKVPFLVQLGLINRDSLRLDLLLVPLVVLGALLGPRVVRRIDQPTFERIAAALIGVAALKLLLF